MGAPKHGINGLIYISGTELVGANAWSIAATRDSVEVLKFDDDWKSVVIGGGGWSGSINAWEQFDEQLLFQAATAGVLVALLIYPDRDDLTDYYSGSAVFGANSSASSTTAVAKDGDFVGSSTLAITGFAA